MSTCARWGPPVLYGEGLRDRTRALAPQGIDAAIDTVGTDEAIDVTVALVADRNRIATIAAFGRGFALGLKVLGGAPGADPGTESAPRLDWSSPDWSKPANSGSGWRPPFHWSRPPPRTGNRRRATRTARSLSFRSAVAEVDDPPGDDRPCASLPVCPVVRTDAVRQRTRSLTGPTVGGQPGVVTSTPESPPTIRTPRPDEAAPADEMTMDRAWITHLRESAIYKLEGLNDAQLRWKPAPTANSLGQIVVHLGYCERLSVRAIFVGEEMDMAWRTAMFTLPDGWSTDDVVAFYRKETAAADAVLDRAASMDQASAGPMRPTTLRWVLTAPHRGDRPARRPHGHHP